MDPQVFHSTLQRARRRRLVRTVVMFAGAVAVVLGVETYRKMTRRQEAQHAASASWNAYARCMVGAPLAEGERASARLLRIELNLREAAGATTKDAWPERCAPLAAKLHESISGARAGALDTRYEKLSELADRVRPELVWSAEPDLADDLWDAATKADLVKADATAGPLRGLVCSRTGASDAASSAPEPARALTAASLAALPIPFAARPEDRDAVPFATARLRFAGTKAAPLVCAFSADAKGRALALVRCAVPESLPTPANEAPIGFVRTPPRQFDRFELVRPRDVAEPVVTPLTSMRAAGLYANQLVWVAPGPHEPDLLMALTVPPGEGALGEKVPLGELTGKPHELAACRTPSSIVTRVRSYDAKLDARETWTTMAFFHDETWKRTPGSAVADSSARLTCHGAEAALTWLAGNAVSQLRCTEDACTSLTSPPLDPPWAHLTPLEAADLDGQVLLVGMTGGSGPFSRALVHSVRMRLAPIDRIASATDVVLWGDRAHEGVDPVAAKVFVRQGAAIVVLTLADDTSRAIRVDPSGAFEAVQIAKD